MALRKWSQIPAWDHNHIVNREQVQTLYNLLLSFYQPKDTYREKAFSNKTSTVWKVWICPFGWLLHQINYLDKIFKLIQNFRKNNLVTGKTSFFVIGRSFFVLPVLFILTLASDRGVLYGDIEFSILALATKKSTSVLWKRFENFFER